MKKAFPGYFPPEEKDINRLWEGCEFVLDTNILLNLYRYSDSTRNDFVRVLRALKTRLWLPHRAAQEYFENRLTVIAQQEKSYDDALKTIQSLQAELSNARQHPFLSDKLMQKLTVVLGDVIKELGATKSAHDSRLSSDQIQKVIGELFNGRVGTTYSVEEFEAISKEGEERYSKKVPPGYKDESKDDGVNSASGVSRKYGDFIIWRQIVDRAAQNKKGVIFVNDDKKEDWYLICRGKTLGPRPELIEEFLLKTGQGFYMYQADRFFELAAKHFEQKIAPESMDEIREIRDSRKRETERHVELLRRREEEVRLRDEMQRQEEIRREEEMMLRSKVGALLEHLEGSRSRLQYLREKSAQLRHAQAIYQEKLERSGGGDNDSLERFVEAQRMAADVEIELERIRDETALVEREYALAERMLLEFQKSAEQRFTRGRG